MTRLLALLLACTALLAAGCGGGDDDEGTTSSDQAPAPSAESGATEVTMKDIKFAPATVTVKAGDTVTWVNDDSVGHDVTADDFKSGKPGDIQGGGTFKHKFATAGTFGYVCSVHPGMEGSVVVK